MSPLKLSLTSTVKLPSGYEIPQLGLGVYKNDDPKPAVLAALKHGYRHIDSAQMYRNEAKVGEALRESGIPREQVFITSKIDSGNHGYEKTLAAVDESLNSFKFDYIDLMLLHSPLSGKERRLEAWRALIEARNKGKLRTIGVSNFGVRHLEEIREAGLETPSVNQIELHPLCQQKEIVAHAKKHNIVIEAYCPLIRTHWTDTIVDVGRKYGKDPAQALVRWSLERGFIPLPKSSNPERVVSNADVYDFELSADDLATLDALDRGKDGAVSWNPVDAP
ncbi:Aldo/keto reductase [Fomes fomentarius]|nr:Aldo/keto reductase [Fomes fomentarius]